MITETEINLSRNKWTILFWSKISQVTQSTDANHWTSLITLHHLLINWKARVGRNGAAFTLAAQRQ